MENSNKTDENPQMPDMVQQPMQNQVVPKKPVFYKRSANKIVIAIVVIFMSLFGYSVYKESKRLQSAKDKKAESKVLLDKVTDELNDNSLVSKETAGKIVKGVYTDDKLDFSMNIPVGFFLGKEEVAAKIPGPIFFNENSKNTPYKFVENIIVLRSKTSEFGPEAITRAVIDRINLDENKSGSKIDRTEKITLNNGDEATILYGDAKKDISIIEMLYFNGNYYYVVSFTAESKNIDAYKNTFLESAKSFKVVQK